MTKLYMDNGIWIRVDLRCSITRKNMSKLYRWRIRQAMRAFRMLFSHKDCVCASEIHSELLPPMTVKGYGV